MLTIIDQANVFALLRTFHNFANKKDSLNSKLNIGKIKKVV